MLGSSNNSRHGQMPVVHSPHLLDGHGEVQDLVVLEVLQSILLDNSHAHVWVAERLDAVSDAHDELVLLAHTLHILSSVGALVCPLNIQAGVCIGCQSSYFSLLG